MTCQKLCVFLKENFWVTTFDGRDLVSSVTQAFLGINNNCDCLFKVLTLHVVVIMSLAWICTSCELIPSIEISSFTTILLIITWWYWIYDTVISYCTKLFFCQLKLENPWLDRILTSLTFSVLHMFVSATAFEKTSVAKLW